MKDYYEMNYNCPSDSFPYIIKSGDTLYNLAKRYNTTVEAIMAINPGVNPNNLQVGQKICIPKGGTPEPRCPVGTFPYTIKQGDTLYNLARRYNTTVEAIMAVNPGIDPNNLQIGQIICIPKGSTPPGCPPGTFSYTIKQGDTLYNLARRYNTTVEAIMAVNPGIDPNNLQIGQIICIPKSSTPPGCDGLYHVVRPGDTLYNLAMKYNTTVEAIMAANPGIDPNNLQVGQLICIPKGHMPIPCPGGVIYEVKANDSLTSILLRFNISVMDLMEGNPNIDIKNIRPGQKLCILPHKDRGCPCPKGTKPYTIMSTDVPPNEPVVVFLARKFNTTVEAIMIANENLSPGHFEVGKSVCIPKM
ncbi:LysM peptidoglycan-binding domain-containing protein [Wansuia hejianensis]|uniref:LysM peptidoglycan-binding domain-containing protein n=1 Tax=Wansuia hejianensis TaxID=2763667 RepID=A0A926EW85_9FIRM|nr:LysM peptidoglycan-binding domain-containing protein [Wansuia hejianensis]MBC8591018.1 LysM peptidoglycan-binding domain-containing protein [Wansuia hejianensis]